MKERLYKFIVVTILFLPFHHVFSQQIDVKGGFIEDHLEIGQNVRFWITATYPPELEIVFPDSNYQFGTFELYQKKYFPTILKDQLAFDSTVYTLQSYEIDPIQYLQLPVILLKQKDSTIIDIITDSILFKHLVTSPVSDTTQLKANLEYEVVNTQFNYILFYTILTIVLVVIILLVIIFGKRILRYFKLRKLHKGYEQFSNSITEFIRRLKKDPQPQTAEEALSLWKNYQEKLENIPYKKFTTKEILALDYTKELQQPLQSIDKMIYGKKASEKIYQNFQQIEDFTQYRFNKKIAKIRDGK